MHPRIIFFILLLIIVSAAMAMYFGVYNVAASEGHSASVYHLMHYAMRRSVAMRARKIDVPALEDRSRVRAGLKHFRRYCIQCHGGPGVAPDPLAIGMIPAPTNLVAGARAWPPEDLYWVIKHGIKMTAMPAWNYKLSEVELWDLVAFLKQLPALSTRDYANLVKEETQDNPVAVPIDTAMLEPRHAGRSEAGRQAIKQYLCATCHEIPGFPGTENEVGPPLAGFARRRYIGGVLLNTPENQVRWLLDPHAIDARSAMPSLGMSEQQARDIAAFLQRLQ